METCGRINDLADYIANQYKKTIEIGIGHSPDAAFALRKRGIKVLATDIQLFQYEGIKFVVDDITAPVVSKYKNVDLIYSLRPPPELAPYMKRLAKMVSADLIIKPLSSEYLDGKLIRHKDTTFYIWKNP